MTDIRNAPLTFRVTPALKQALDRAAKADHRTVANKLEMIVTQWLETHGYLGNEPEVDLETRMDRLGKMIEDAAPKATPGQRARLVRAIKS